MYLNELKKIPLGKLDSTATKRQLSLLRKLGIEFIGDILDYFPFRYDDRSKTSTIQESFIKKIPVTVIATVLEHEFIYFNGKRHPKILIQDEETRAYLIGFNRDYLKKSLKIGQKYWVYGQFVYKYNEIQASSFDFEEYSENKKPKSFGAVLPVYNLTEGLYLKELRAVLKRAFEVYMPQITDELPEYILAQHHLLGKSEALSAIHYPGDEAGLKKAKLRLAYEEFLAIQLAVQMKRVHIRTAEKPFHYPERKAVQNFIKSLPYALTGAQARVLQELTEDMALSKPMHRLVQGDVGSGKTTLALGAMVLAGSNGYQAALMVPTEVLAVQHYANLRKAGETSGLTCGILTGSLSAAEKREVYQGLKDGSIHLVVGTHALIQPDVEFKNLALAVFDEQHRFGVEQRILLAAKGKNPDILVMTATPIPRTLTLTIYGDLDVSVVDELPKGRLPVKTKWVVKKAPSPKKVPEANQYAQLLNFTANELASGCQAYFICPLIEESEKSDLEAAEKVFEKLKNFYTNYNIGLLHGRLPSAEKQRVLEEFRQGKIAVLVSTTVIEVGIDVKNATVMVIEGADRFGLSQLHQLRGRVGRGEYQSYCALVTPEEFSDETKARMEAMVQFTDGFKIAEEDLRLRGPGEILGIKQSGMPELKVADFLRDEKLLTVSKQDAANILNSDPDLSKPVNLPLKDGIIRFLPADYLYSG